MRCALITVVRPEMTGAGGKIAVYGVATSLKRANLSVTVLHCDNNQTQSKRKETDFDIITCTSDGDGEEWSLKNQIERLKPDIIWLYTTRSWKVYYPLELDYPVILLAGDPRDRIEHYRFKWTHAANSKNLIKRLWARVTAYDRIRRIKKEERKAMRQAHDSGIAAAYGPGDIDYIRSNAGVPVSLCELSFPSQNIVKSSIAPNFLILGNFSTVHTRYGLEYFFTQIWPLWEKSELIDRCTVRVVGAGKLPKNLELPPERQGLKFVGFAQDLEREFESTLAALVSVPIRIGFRTRVIESWSRGVPIILDDSSANGLPEVKDGFNCLVASAPEQWLERASMILDDPELTRRIAEGGRATFEDHYLCDKPEVAERYARISAKAIEKWERH